MRSLARPTTRSRRYKRRAVVVLHCPAAAVIERVKTFVRGKSSINKTLTCDKGRRNDEKYTGQRERERENVKRICWRTADTGNTVYRRRCRCKRLGHSSYKRSHLKKNYDQSYNSWPFGWNWCAAHTVTFQKLRVKCALTYIYICSHINIYVYVPFWHDL